jgi:hypothetical protein
MSLAAKPFGGDDPELTGYLRIEELELSRLADSTDARS